MVNVLTHLDSELYKPGEIIVPFDGKIEEMIVVASGNLNLYGLYDHRGETHKMLIAHLPYQSWYGDFQIFLNVESTF